MRSSLALLVLFAGCGHPPPVTPFDAGFMELTDGGLGLTDGGVVCTAALEAQMVAAFQTVPATESFYVELRRESDGRLFRTSRTVAGKAPVTEATMLQSASTAKWVSATVILDLVATPSRYPGSRPLSLETRVADVLPSWRTSSGAIPSTNRLATVTLRQLLSFTSGLEREHACISSLTDPDACVTSLVDANLALNADGAAPRTFFYDGSHLFVAAQVAVRASGLGSWGALFKRFKEQHHVFETPLESPGQAAFGVGAFFPVSAPGNSPSPAGALRYTAGDYPLFLQKLLRAELLPRPMLDELLGDQVARVGATIEYSPLLDDGEDWRYGLGNWTECRAATWSATCLSARRFSSPGSFGTYPFLDFNPSASGEAPFVGILGYGGTTQGQAGTTIAIYRVLGGGLDTKDLAQRWAASTCP